MFPLEKRWDLQPCAGEREFQALEKYPRIVRQLLINRGITEPDLAEQYLNGEGSLYDPLLMKNMEIAVKRILQAVERHELIAIYGDYDVDGITATTLLVQFLKRMGADVMGYIPDRFEEGYGLNVHALEKLFRRGVRLVITVDCGIRSMTELSHASRFGLPMARSRKLAQKARETKHQRHIRSYQLNPELLAAIKTRLSKRLDIIVTDHHEPGKKRLPAVAIINPRQDEDLYPEKNLAGVGLAYKIVEAVLKVKPIPGLNADDWLDLVAIGTVADIVPLTDENRALVRAGLKQIHKTRNQGLKSLSGAAGIKVEKINARDIGYRIGPRLNAAGRLQSAMKAFDLLNSPDVQVTGRLALELDTQNKERQKRTREMQEKVIMSDLDISKTNLIFAIHPDFDMNQSGLIGLVASRLTENFYRPAVVCCQNHEVTRASCRSIPEFHITQALDKCEDLLVKYGGHAMAAGFTVRNENLAELRRRLITIADEELRGKDLQPVVRADMEISLDDIAPLFKYLEYFEPIGQGNPVPTFITKNLQVKSPSCVGNDFKHLRLVVSNGKVSYTAIAFSQGHWKERLPQRIDIIYTCEIDDFRYPPTIQLNISDIKPAVNQ